MAKGKHAAALFEVIHSGKPLGAKETAGLLRTPKWWFKGRKREEAPAPPPDASGPIDSATITPIAASHARIAAVLDPSSMTAPAPRQPGIDLKLDPDRQQITFRVSYTSAIVTAFSVLVVVALAYVIGRNMSRGPSPALAGPSTKQVRQGPARPEVMDLSNKSSRSNPNAPTRRPDPREPDDGIASAAMQAQRSPTNANQPSVAPPNATAPAPAPVPGKRTLNLNYVIVQSYPDETSAKDAVAILGQHGITATIERGLRGYGSSWYTVVGMEGFARARGPEYDGHVARIQKISEAFAGKKSFKAFQPLPYKWDRS